MRRLTFLLLAAAVVILLSSNAAADITYDVTVNTSTLSGTTGLLDFTFGSGITSLPATATISNFDPLAGVGAGTIAGDANGSLNPGPLTINNTPGFNDFNAAFTFGNSLSFTLVFSGQAIDLPDPLNFPDGSTFAFSIFDQFDNPVGNNPFGFLVTVDLNSDGTQTPEVFSNDASIALVQPPPAQVPEPSTWTMLPAFLAGMGILRKKLHR